MTILMSEHEATVDICLHLTTIRNLSDNYLTKSHFRVSMACGSSTASPYQIIPHTNISTISLTDYISPLFTLAPKACILLQELAVFKALVPLSALQEAQLQITLQLCEAGGDTDQIVDQICLQYAGLVGLSSYMPICFAKARCAIDASITSQFLSCRFRNILAAPKALLYSAVERLLISFNRLRQRLSMDAEGCEYGVQSFPEMQQVRKFAKARIFLDSQEEQRIKLLDFERKLPRVSFCVQQLWGRYLSNELAADIGRYRRNFLKSYAMQVRHRVQREATEDYTIVDGLKLPAFPIGIKTIAKAEAQFHKNEQNLHIMLLVHGFGASSKTLQQLQLVMRFFYPNLQVVASRVNQNRTDDDINEMGRRLALQVEASLQSFQAKDDFSLSFVGHSMGGLIIRAALPLLERHRFNMRLYVSLGTPHLGYLFHNSSLTKMGMWAYELFRSSPAMSALLMRSRSGDPRQTFLYQLSRTTGLDWFQQVLLYAGNGDCYVSEQSALMQSSEAICEQAEKGVQRGMLWEEMRKSLSEQMKDVGVSKYVVDFSKQNQLNQGSLTDQLLGRRNHINLATSGSFVVALSLFFSSNI